MLEEMGQSETRSCFQVSKLSAGAQGVELTPMLSQAVSRDLDWKGAARTSCRMLTLGLLQWSYVFFSLLSKLILDPPSYLSVLTLFYVVQLLGSRDS